MAAAVMVAVLILVLVVLGGWYVWEDLGDLLDEQVADEIGADGSLGDALGVREPGWLTAELTCASVVGADDFDGAAR